MEVTELPKRRRVDHKARHWFITWNSYPEDWKVMLGGIVGLTKYCVQEEKGDTGNEHLQGVLVFRDPMSWIDLCGFAVGCHFEKARDLKACVKYCSKERTRDGELWCRGFKLPEKVRDPLEGKELYKFQKDIIALVEADPDERSIYWYWSQKGNIGKSSLCKHLCLKYGAISLGGKVSDAMYAVAKLVSEGNPPGVVIFDVARSEARYLKYVSLELLKNGCFFSGKYESAQCLMNPPHVIVFANEEPDTNKLSRDRWKVTCLDFDTDLPGSALDYL